MKAITLLLLLHFSAVHGMVMMDAAATKTWKPRPIPKDPLVIGYAHNATSGKVIRAIDEQGGGVNVICWSFIDMKVVKNNNKLLMATWTTNLDLEAIREIREQFPNVLHMAAIGGWNGPHPIYVADDDDENLQLPNGQDWCNAFVAWNRANGNLFDGIDWDLEGHDDRHAPTAKFTLETLNIMADLSRCAKNDHGLVVSMAPAESYLDGGAAAVVYDDENQELALSFSLDLNLFPIWWRATEKDFLESTGFCHAGRNCYAHVWHRAGGNAVFDWVSIQLYEAYSRYLYETTRRRQGIINPVQAMLRRIQAFSKGFVITTNAPSTPNSEIRVQIPPNQLVLGIGNGWTDGVKFAQVDPNDIAQLKKLQGNEPIRGVMFWTIDEEPADEDEEESGLLSSALSRALNTS